MKITKILPGKFSISKVVLAGFVLVFSVFFVAGATTQEAYAGKKCGKGSTTVNTKLDLGCKRQNKNPIIDLAYALIRFLSVGVGIVVVASVVFAGIMYTTSEGNPEKTAQAKSRIQTSIMALILYLFIFAIVQYLVPGGLF